MSPRTGRRPAGADSKGLILAVARSAFALAGYESTSLRGIARDAGVDPALVVHYFGSKDRLFAAAMRLPEGLFDDVVCLITENAADVGERGVRLFLSVWESPESREPLLAVLRSAMSHKDAAASLREFLTDTLLGRLDAGLDMPDRQLRATLASSQLVGMAMLRYVVGMEPLASAEPEVLVSWLGPTLQRYLTETSP